MLGQKHAVHSFNKRIFGKYVEEENLVMKKQLQAVEEFNTVNGNKMSYRSMSQINYWCEPKLSET